jgi:hypothetical protein
VEGYVRPVALKYPLAVRVELNELSGCEPADQMLCGVAEAPNAAETVE